MTEASPRKLPKYFVVSHVTHSPKVAKHYTVKSGIVEREVKGYYDMRPINMMDMIYRVKKEYAYDSVEGAENLAVKMIESDKEIAIDALETSVKLLKLN